MISNERTEKATKLREKNAESKQTAVLLRDQQHTVKEISEIMTIPESSVLALLK